MTEAVIRPAVPEDFPLLAALWERSVRATHDFLGEADIAALLPEVEAALPAVEELWTAESAGVPAGFLGLNGCMVEMLFVDPAHRGTGIGSALLAHARARRAGQTLRLDVNEQNPAAAGFYQAQGFRQCGRSDHDSAGRPFPIIHMTDAGVPAGRRKGSR